MKNFASAIHTHQALLKWAAALVAGIVLAAVLFAGTGTVNAAQNVKSTAEYEAAIAALTQERDAAIAARAEAEVQSKQQIELLMQDKAQLTQALTEAREECDTLRQSLTETEEQLSQIRQELDQTAAELLKWKDRFGTQYNIIFEIRRKGNFLGFENSIWATLPVTREQYQQLSGMTVISQSLPFLSVPGSNALADWVVTVTNAYTSSVEMP